MESAELVDTTDLFSALPLSSGNIVGCAEPFCYQKYENEDDDRLPYRD